MSASNGVPLNQETPIHSIAGYIQAQQGQPGGLECHAGQTLMRANLGTRSAEMRFAMAMYMTYKAIIHGMLS
jgi:hypothetical protein